MKLQEHNARNIRNLVEAVNFEAELLVHSKLTSTNKYGWPGEDHIRFVDRLRELALRARLGEEITVIPDIDVDDLDLAVELRAYDDLCIYCTAFINKKDCRVLFVS